MYKKKGIFFRKKKENILGVMPPVPLTRDIPLKGD
jgi:hypothetical protein